MGTFLSSPRVALWSNVDDNYKLSRVEIGQIQYIWNLYWIQRAELGPQLQFEVIMVFLKQNGYKVVPCSQQENSQEKG